MNITVERRDSVCKSRTICTPYLLMNMLDDVALNAWNPKAGANDDTQRRLTRMFRSKSIMAWAEILRDAVCAAMDIQDSEDRSRPFYRDLSTDSLSTVRRVVSRLANWKWWAAPPNEEIDRVLSDNKSEVKAWLKNKGLTTGFLLGAPE